MQRRCYAGTTHILPVISTKYISLEYLYFLDHVDAYKAECRIMQDEDHQRVHELFAAVGKTVPPRTDISAMQWLREQVRQGSPSPRSMVMLCSSHSIPYACVDVVLVCQGGNCILSAFKSHFVGLQRQGSQ